METIKVQATLISLMSFDEFSATCKSFRQKTPMNLSLGKTFIRQMKVYEDNDKPTVYDIQKRFRLKSPQPVPGKTWCKLEVEFSLRDTDWEYVKMKIMVKENFQINLNNASIIELTCHK